MTHTMVAQIGDWTFWAWDGHPFDKHAGKPLYAYEPVTEPGIVPGQNTGEWFPSIDRAMIAAVGEKYTGPRGAGGTGVGTAADWFARMIGMDTLVEVNYQDGQKAVNEILAATQADEGKPMFRRARAVTTELEARGLVLATRQEP
jgi:hypothetical protein